MPEMPRDLENRSATVAIIGAGPLGRWLALATARAGFRVLLEDVMPANLHHAQEYIRQQFNVESGGKNAGPSTPHPNDEDLSLGTPDPSAVADSAQDDIVLRAQDDSIVAITFVSTIEDAVREADLAIDCVPDELESKLEILWLLDRMAPPRTVLATPTTRLSIADLANCTYRPAKCVAIAAEASSLAANAGGEILLRTTSRTSPETVALVDHFWRQLGFTPRFEPDPAEQPAS
jgi:3-hydroxybutyryl-CoA dehydrogenase